jgi:hypothetical protein
MRIGFLTFNLGDLNNNNDFTSRLDRSQLKDKLDKMGQNVDMICISTQEDDKDSRFITWAAGVLGQGWTSLYDISMNSANRGKACKYTSVGNSIVNKIPFVVHLAIFVRYPNNFSPVLVKESDKTCSFHVIRPKKQQPQGLFSKIFRTWFTINTYYDKSSVVAVIQYGELRFAIASCHFPFNKQDTNDITIGQAALNI